MSLRCPKPYPKDHREPIRIELNETTILINNGHGIAPKGWKLEGQWLINDTMRLIFNAGAIDLENEAFALPCQIRDGCA